jgi:hypothetical protein
MSSNFNCSYMARSSLTYIPFLAHLAFRPGELLPSLFVRRRSVNISHFNLLLRNHWANCNQTLVEWSLGAALEKCVQWYRLPTKIATKLKMEKRGMKFLKNLLLWNYGANLNQTLLKWSLGGPLPKLCPAFQTSDQDGHHSRT